MNTPRGLLGRGSGRGHSHWVRCARHHVKKNFEGSISVARFTKRKTVKPKRRNDRKFFTCVVTFSRTTHPFSALRQVADRGDEPVRCEANLEVLPPRDAGSRLLSGCAPRPRGTPHGPRSDVTLRCAHAALCRSQSRRRGRPLQAHSLGALAHRCFGRASTFDRKVHDKTNTERTFSAMGTLLNFDVSFHFCDKKAHS